MIKPPSRRPRDIFELALDFDSSVERMDFARRECGDDTSLFEQVRALIEADAAASAFLPDVPPDLPEVQRPEEPEEIAGRYRLERKIGEGGCGAVYLAEQQEPIRRKVALKVIKLGMDTQSVIHRFAAERQALALMDHPHIARVFDAGATAAGRPYFVMEWVDGERITHYCNTHGLGLRERLELFIPVCRAVQHAHQKGVIHRDLKPSNILVAAHDGQPVPKLIDFGIAKAMQAPLTENTIVTHVQAVLGTPAYMSPEQANLGAADIDTRADIYSLGVVLYELLTGEPPFDGQALLQSGLDVLRRTLREIDPPTPSKRIEGASRRRATSTSTTATTSPAVTPSLAPLPADLDWIVMKCLEKDRARRYDSANELAQDLRRHLDDEPVIARPPSRRYQLQKLMRRNRGVFSALAAIAAVLIGAVIISTSQAVRARRAERFEHDQRQRAERSEQAALEARTRARQQAYTSDMKSAGYALERNELGQVADLLRAHVPQPGDPDLRGLEWRYLWQASRGQESRSLAANAPVYATRLAPDGQRVALAHFGGEIQIVDLPSNQVLQRFPGSRDNNVRERIAFSPDGTLFAAGDDQRVAIRDTANWKTSRELPGAAESVAFAPDGRRFAFLHKDGLDLYQLPDWNKPSRISTPAAGWGRVAFDGGGRRVAVLRRAHPVVEVWDAEAGEKISEVGGGELPLAAALSPDGRQLAVGDSPGTLRLWDVASRTLIASTKAHGRWVYAVAFSPDGRALATCGGDHLVALWELPAPDKSGQTWAPRQTLRGHHSEVWSLQFSADGDQLVSAGREGAVKFWDWRAPARTPSAVVLPPNSMWLGFLSDARQGLLLSIAPHALRVVDVAANALVQTNAVIERQGAVAFDGTHATYGGTNGHAYTWNVASGQRVRDVPLTTGPVLALQTSSDLNYFLGWDKARGMAAVWDFTTGAHVADLADFAPPEMIPTWSMAQQAAFSPDGRRLAYASSNYAVKVWDVAARQEAFTLHGHTWHIQCLRFSPDSRWLATGSWDSHVRLWDPATGRPAGPPLKAHSTGIGNLSFSPCGRTLLVRTGDDVLHFHSLANGLATLAIPGVTSWFFNLLAPNGNALAWQAGSGSDRHPISILPTLAEIDRAGEF